ncbi:MAG: YceD family protein [Deinococcales bacterium]
MNQLPSLNLSKILRGGGDVSDEGFTSVLEYTEHGASHPLPLVGNAEWRAIASHIGDNEYWLAGRIRATLLLECGRCLDPVEHRLEARLETLLHFKPSVKIPTRSQTQDDEDVVLFGDPSLDLSALFAESLMLEIPNTVRCKSDCRGLCSECGTNLNRATACPSAAPDCPAFGSRTEKRENPFSALKDLFKS